MCESQPAEMISTFTSGDFSFYHCLKCGGIFANPMKQAGKEWYESSDLYVFPSDAEEHLQWHEIVFINEKIIFEGKKVLNIGCGKNIFLKKLLQVGCNVTAIDINEKAIDFTKKILGVKDAHVDEVVKFTCSYQGDKFDIIIFFEVLEHLESPREFITGLKGILQDNGIIVFSVPNRDRFFPSLHKADYPPHHLTRWNINSVKNFLEINGFSPINVIVSPLNAWDLFGVFRALCGMSYFEDKINMNGKNFFMIFCFKALSRLLLAISGLLAAMLRLFVKTKGVDIYATAGVQMNDAENKCNYSNI